MNAGGGKEEWVEKVLAAGAGGAVSVGEIAGEISITE